MTKKSGFTLVELIVVIAVIAILATLAVFGLNRYQQDGRDTQRSANVKVIAEALEKYYDAQGEYPSCSAITAPADTVATDTLVGIDKDNLRVPNAPTGETNSIRCGQTLATNGDDFYEYSGDNTVACTGNESCTTFTLKYRSESDDAILSLTSRRTAS